MRLRAGSPTTGWTTPLAWLRRAPVAHRRLRQAVREFPPVRVYDRVGPGDGLVRSESFYVTLHGLAQHDAYHTGQISLLKRAMAGERR